MQKLRILLCLVAMMGLHACASDSSGANAMTPLQGSDDARAEGESSAPAPVVTPRPAAGGTSSGMGASPLPPSTPSAGPSATPAAGTPAPMSAPDSDSSEAPVPGTGAAPSRPVQSGTLTAGVWDDNRNFDRFLAYRAKQQSTRRQGILPLTDEEHDNAHNTFTSERQGRTTLDVSLVIDTTGSMGDEIAYLQTEFLALSRAIQSEYPDAAQRWSLVVYRDVGDVYVAKSFDFTEDVEAFRSKLASQFADGGGDYPEAPDAALAAMAELDWRGDDATSRLAFWIADAPHHDDKAADLAEALRDARNLDVHIYPVASSGVDEFTELAMRSAAQFTGGRYVFLTNDSGVGGAHKEPSIPCYFVTRLDQAILRMVSIELSGTYSEPAADDVIRRGGNPQSGSCKLESGDTVAVF